MRRLAFFQRGESMGDESARVLGAIEASIEHTASALETIQEQQTKLGEVITSNHLETTKGFGELETKVALVDQKLDTHIDTTTRCISLCEDATKGNKAGGNGTLATGVAGLTGGALLAGKWIYDKFSGG